MKRVWLLLLCGLLLVTSGCAYAAAQMTEDSYYSLYFPVRDLDTANGGDAIQTVASQLSREDDREEPRQLAEELLHQLLDGPGEDTSLRTPFPVGTVLQDLTVEGAHAWVDLSGAYGTLSGIALTMADYCITLTLTQLPEIRTVSITVRGQELAYRETQNFSARDVLLSSTEDVVERWRSHCISRMRRDALPESRGRCPCTREIHRRSPLSRRCGRDRRTGCSFPCCRRALTFRQFGWRRISAM